ncbi:hypothetical protein EDD99_3228 [Streptomyces sp. 846.5]|nr:DUF6879 family protein [Streptomyces sp. 846.5]TDU04753.1 hypothetical protein EDD99_3228 [Streptomyces sp. 846.5]
MLLAGSRWREFFDSMECEAFRLETLPVYRVPQEEDAVRRFLAGEPLPLSATQGWTTRIQGYADSGRKVRRVHVLTRPLTDYLRFEFEHYRHNVAAGEDIRILDITEVPNPGLPDQDFWLFDESRVVLMNYEADGTQIDREILEGDPGLYREWRRIALESSVPFLEYLKEYG